MVSIFYFNYYALKLKGPVSTQFTILNGLNTLLKILEILALLVLTYVSSGENFGMEYWLFTLDLFAIELP